MNPEDILIHGVAGIIAANRAFTGPGLRSSALAFAATQSINIAACAGLYFLRLDDFPRQLDAAVRLFLTGIVTWHMVLNYQSRQLWLRNRELDARRDEERAMRLEQLADDLRD